MVMMIRRLLSGPIRLMGNLRLFMMNRVQSDKKCQCTMRFRLRQSCTLGVNAPAGNKVGFFRRAEIDRVYETQICNTVMRFPESQHNFVKTSCVAGNDTPRVLSRKRVIAGDMLYDTIECFESAVCVLLGGKLCDSFRPCWDSLSF